MTIGLLSSETGVPVETIRYYERIGLLPRPARRAGGFREYDGPIELGPFHVEAHQVVHPVTAFALRVTADGRTLVYSGDTGPCPALDEVAADAHLLLAEASFQTGDDNPPDLHLTGADCGRTASKAGVERLVLTHIPPWHDPQVVLGEAVGEYDGKVELATPGASYDV